MTSSRVTGHTLREEGRAMSGRRCEEGPCASDAPNGTRQHVEGHGECSCGAQSPHLAAQRARQAWHREHKAGVTAPEAKAGQRWRSKSSARVIELDRWDPEHREWQAHPVRRQPGARRLTNVRPATLLARYELVPESLLQQPPG